MAKIKMYVGRHGGEAFVTAVLVEDTLDIYYASLSAYINGYSKWSDNEYKQAVNKMLIALGSPSNLVVNSRASFGPQKKTWLDDRVKGDQMFAVDFPGADEVMNLLIQFQKAKDALEKASFPYKTL